MCNNLRIIEIPRSEYDNLIKTGDKYYYHHYPNKKVKSICEMPLIKVEDGHLSMANTP